MYYLLGSAVVLSGFFVVHALLAATTSAGGRIYERRAAMRRPSVRAAIWFYLILLPAAGALLGSVLLATAFVLYEPANADESVSWWMGICAALGGFGLIRATVMFVVVRRATRTLIRDWERRAVPTTISGWTGPALRLEHAFPLLAVVGIRRPRLFVAGQVLDQLDEAEVVAAVAHERGHLIARDNLKRVLVNFAGQLAWWVPGTRSLRALWVDAAEHAADEYAAAGTVEQPLNLASALVKLARLAPSGSTAAMPTGAFLIETAGDILTRRVTWLVGTESSKLRFRFDPRSRNLILASSMILAGALAFLFIRFDLLVHLHELIEVFVQAPFFRL